MALTQLKALRKKHKMKQKQLANKRTKRKEHKKVLEMRNLIEEKDVDKWDYNWYD